MAQRIAGVLLDLGQTLLTFGKVDVAGLFGKGSREVYDKLVEMGHALPPFRRYNRGKLLAIRWAFAKSRIWGREFDVVDMLQRTHSRMGVELSRSESLELAAMWYEPLSRTASVAEGAVEALADLRRRGLALGLVSNTFVPGEVLDRHLARVGLIEFFPVRVYSCQVVHRKPSGRIFEAALSRLGLPARQTLFVGDSVLADVRGANRAGLISVLKEPVGTWRLWRFRPRHTINRLAELAGIVDQYNRD